MSHAANAKAVAFVVRDNKARRTSITIGDDDGSMVEVLSGLDSADEVIIRPGTSLDDGASVIATIAPSKGLASR